MRIMIVYLVLFMETLIITSQAENRPEQTQKWLWQPVPVGGGGWVTGMVCHPKIPNLRFVKTDVGGIYRWDPRKKRWRSCSHWVPHDQPALFGVDALAISPDNVPVLYAALGRKLGRRSPVYAGIFKSTDFGITWQRLNFPEPENIDANTHSYYHIRTCGQRLAINPFNTREILYGCVSGSMGLWQTHNTGQTWQRLHIGNLPPSEEIIVSVLFDQNRKGYIYALVHDSGLWYSPDDGISWQKISCADGTELHPVFVRNMEQASDGTIYFTVTCPQARSYQKGTVWKIVANEAVDITPAPDEIGDIPGKSWVGSKGFQGIAVDPHHPQHVLIEGGISSCAPGIPVPIFETRDGGMTWHKITFNISGLDGWRAREKTILTPSVSDLVWDPQLPSRVYHLDGSGICILDFNQKPALACDQTSGIEELVIFDLALIPNSGRDFLFSAFADYGGCFHDQGLCRLPSSLLHPRDCGQQSGHSFAWSPSVDPVVIYYSERGSYVHAKSRHKKSGYYALYKSTDKGRSWQRFPNRPGQRPPSPFPVRNSSVRDDVNPLQLVVSPFDPNNLIVVGKNPMVSLDGGQTWQPCLGLNDLKLDNNWIWAKTAAVSPFRPGNFFAYVPNRRPRRGEIYRSRDGGRHWEMICSNLPAGKVYIDPVYLSHDPWLKDALWINLQEQGLWYSVNGGEQWQEIAGFSSARQGNAYLMALGCGPGNRKQSVIYVLGSYGGKWGLWLSCDHGHNWREITPVHFSFAGAKVLTASLLHFGHLYLGTAGRGIFHLSPPQRNSPE